MSTSTSGLVKAKLGEDDDEVSQEASGCCSEEEMSRRRSCRQRKWKKAAQHKDACSHGDGGDLGMGSQNISNKRRDFLFFFFFVLNVDTHPYERTHVNPIPMSIFKDWADKSED